MKIKRLKSIKINSYTFFIKWDASTYISEFSYGPNEISIGTKDSSETEILMHLMHELTELVALELHVRFRRTDCGTDYIFMYDHRQHDTMSNMLTGLISEFI